MAFTSPPTPPNSGDPANFNVQADTFLGWMAIFANELKTELPYITAKAWATIDPTSVNLLVLTAGFSSLVDGLQVRFRPANANTGATQINLDGLGTRQCVTPTGAALPAGYIRAGVETTATYNGTSWVVGRLIERGSNSNGDFERFSNGLQLCFTRSNPNFVTNIAEGPLFVSPVVEWQFPATFSELPKVFTNSPEAVFRWGTMRATSVNGAQVRVMSAVNSSTAVRAELMATGRWY